MFGKISTRVCEIDWRGRLLTSAAVVALSTTVFAGSALAQDPPAEGASAPPPAEEVGAPPMAVEKVVVTATRRETQLIKTPIAVTAISGKTLEAAEVENIEDLMAVVPSLVVTNNGHPFAFTTRIRGIGTQGDNPGLEAAVGTFVDGVYRNRPGIAMSDVGDMERVEVLRGPQGTLFGRNTSAGIINVLTRKPTWDNQMWAEVTGGSYDLLAARGGFNAVIAQDTLAARFNFVRQEREGYIDVNPGRPDSYDGNATSFWGGRGQFLYQPNQDVSLRLIGDYAERKDQCCSAVTIANGVRSGAGTNFGFGRAPTVAFPDTSGPAIINSIEAPFPGKATTNQLENLIAFGDRSTDTNTTDKGVSGELNWRFGGVKLTSITSYREWENDYGQDIDFSGADIAYFPDDGTNFNKFETITHETRLNGETGWVNWLVGVFYSNEDISRQQSFRWGADAERFISQHRVGDLLTDWRTNLGLGIGTPALTPNTGYTDNFEQSAESFAAFTHNVFHLTDDLDLIAGLRWTTETKDFRASYQTTNQAGCSALEATFGLDPSARAAFLGAAPATQRLIALTCAPFSRNALDVFTAAAPHLQERTEDEFSGIATLAYQFNPNVNTYATYSRGHKAGGFNLDRVFRDGPGLAGSIVVSPINPVGQTVRAPNTSFDSELVDAYELGLKLASDDNTFQMNVAGFYQDFENFQLNTFTGVSFIVTSVPEVISQGVEVETFWSPFRDFTTNLGVAYTDARYGEDLGTFVTNNTGLFALPGERLTHSPEWTVTGGVDYSFPFLDTLTARLHMDGRWQSEMDTGSNLDARKIQEAYAVFGAKIGFYSEDELFGLEFFARNLFDESYINTAFDAPLQGSALCSSTLEPTFCPAAANASQSSTIDAFVGEPRMLGATLRIKH